MITINKDTLLKEIDLAAGVAASKGSIPILNNVLLTAGDNQLGIWSTDLDASLQTRCEAETGGDSWAVGVNARKFREIVALLPQAEINLEHSDQHLRIISGRSKYRLSGVKAADFPTIPDVPKTSVRLPVDSFRRAAAAVLIAISQAESRYILSGAKCEIKAGRLRLVATDGQRMMLVDAQVEAQEEVDLLVSKALLASFPRMVDEGVEHFDLAYDGALISLQIGHRTFFARRLSGQFPNYDQVIPNHPHSATVNGVLLQAAIRRSSLMADSKSMAVKTVIKPDEIQISAQNAETGEAEDHVSAVSTSPDVQIGLNAKYALDYFSVFPDGDVRINFKDGASQIEMAPAKSDGIEARYIVMPMRF